MLRRLRRGWEKLEHLRDRYGFGLVVLSSSIEFMQETTSFNRCGYERYKHYMSARSFDCIYTPLMPSTNTLALRSRPSFEEYAKDRFVY